jgi:hypothetical protein
LTPSVDGAPARPQALSTEEHADADRQDSTGPRALPVHPPGWEPTPVAHRTAAAPAVRPGSQRRAAAWSLTALATVALVGMLQSPPGHHLLVWTGAASGGNGYTEVAVSRAPTVKKGPRGNGLGITFALTVHNVEGGVRSYRWKLVTIASTSVRPSPAGSLTLEDDARRAIDVRAVVRCDSGAARTWVGVRVDPEPATSVGTWLDCPGATQ